MGLCLYLLGGTVYHGIPLKARKMTRFTICGGFGID